MGISRIPKGKNGFIVVHIIYDVGFHFSLQLTYNLQYNLT